MRDIVLVAQQLGEAHERRVTEQCHDLPGRAQLDDRQRALADDAGQRIDPRLATLGEDVLADLFAKQAHRVVDNLLRGESAVRFSGDDDVDSIRLRVRRDLRVLPAQHLLADDADECRLADASQPQRV